MPSIVIVALPDPDEPVMDLSSEKVPHLTLLHLDTPLGVDQEEIVKFVQHATNTSLKVFGLGVERRGTLGPDDADVLFFDNSYASDIRNFRAQLLKHDVIAKHYVKTDQFPGWIPHLTMGYPAAPAKKDTDRHSLRWITFNRIAVWTSSYDGPEFDLNTNDGVAWSDDPSELVMHADTEPTVNDVFSWMTDDKKDLVAILTAAEDEEFSDDELDAMYSIYEDMDDIEIDVMNFIVGSTNEPITHSVDSLAEEIMHFGTKGMKWGVRNSDSLLRGSASTHVTLSGRIRGKDQAVNVKGLTVRQVAKRAVKSGNATLGQAHMAAMKSKGHRVVNAFLGDKTYWKRSLAIAAVSSVAAGVIVVGPGLLPVAAVSGAAAAKALAVTGMASYAANTANAVSNVYRAVVSTGKINKSYEALGKSVNKSQRSGSDKVTKLLSKNGSIPRKRLTNRVKHSEVDGVFIQHHGVPDDEHLVHFGTKGMRWGVRRPTDSSGLAVGTVADAIKKVGGSSQDITGGDTTLKKGKQSADHRQLQKNLKKDVASLSTADIKQITARVKAMNELKSVTKAQKEAKRSFASKVAKWALGAVLTGAKAKGESYIKEATGDLLDDLLPKTKSSKARDKKSASAAKDKADKSAKKDADTRSEAVAKLAMVLSGSDDVYKITSMPDPKKGG
jgi:hypothetical protein